MLSHDAEFETNSSLLRHLADSGNREAWSEFLGRYQPMIVRWCRGWLLSEDETQEILGRVLYKLAREMSDFRLDRNRGRFRGWLKTVVQHEVQDYWRGLERCRGSAPSFQVTPRRLERIIDPLSLEQFSEQLSEGIDADLHLLHELIESTRQRVEEGTWLAFWKTTVEGLAAAEAAAELKLSVAAVSQAKYRISNGICIG